MTVNDLFRKASHLLRPRSAEIEGTIEEVRVLEGGDRERWLLKLDVRDDAVFLYEPSPISRPRKKGQRVRIGYTVEPGHHHPLRADWVAAA
jgi:hypothetical protein